jgi:hypothetical protein
MSRCCNYKTETGKCSSKKGSCPQKDLNNLDCKCKGDYREGYQPAKEKVHNYNRTIGGEFSNM